MAHGQGRVRPGRNLCHLDGSSHDRPLGQIPAYPCGFWLWAGSTSRRPSSSSAVFLANRKHDAPATGADLLLSVVVGRIIAVVGGLSLLTGVFLFLFPDRAVTIWPWTLTPLTSQVLGAIFCLGSRAGTLFDRRAEQRSGAASVAALMLALIVVAGARATGEFDSANAMTWLISGGFVVVLAAMCPVPADGGTPGPAGGRGLMIDALIERMQALLEPLQAADDPRQYFHAAYLRTTIAVAEAIRGGGFIDRRLGGALGRHLRELVPGCARGRHVRGTADPTVADRIRRAERPAGPESRAPRHERPYQLRPAAGTGHGDHRRGIRRSDARGQAEEIGHRPGPRLTGRRGGRRASQRIRARIRAQPLCDRSTSVARSGSCASRARKSGPTRSRSARPAARVPTHMPPSSLNWRSSAQPGLRADSAWLCAAEARRHRLRRPAAPAKRMTAPAKVTSGRVALVTGASSGIGEATARGWPSAATRPTRPPAGSAGWTP